MHKSVFVLLLCSLCLCQASWTVVSSTCVVRVGSSIVSSLKCPEQSQRFPRSLEELRDNLEHGDEEQKFCCGKVQARFCCSREAKLAENPHFRPHQNDENDDKHDEEDDFYIYDEDEDDSFTWFSIKYFVGLVLGLLVLFTLCYVFSSIVCMALEIICLVFAAIARRCKGRDAHQVDLESPKTGLIRRDEMDGGNNGRNNYRAANVRDELYQWEQPPPSYSNVVASRNDGNSR